MNLAPRLGFRSPLISLPKPARPRMYRTGLVVLLIAFLPFLVLHPSQSESQAPVADTAEEHMHKGEVFYQRGVFGEAAVNWMEAARLYEEAGQLKQQSLALLYLSQALERIGQTRNAIQTLETARDLANRVKDTGLVTRILGRLGHIHLRLGKEKEALAYVTLR